MDTRNNQEQLEVIQRYNRSKEEDNLLLNPMSEVKLWQMEAAVLKQQLESLQETHRQVMGKEISSMGIEDLRKLENRLETSLKGIRSKKDEIFEEEIQDLIRKINGSRASAVNCLMDDTDRGLINLQLSQPHHRTHGIPET
ncbi:hypothetical protein L1887_36027 [Cichorium endivia]|nr:hypothetical protein L1887_36027 [Cichorium endivia]